MSVSSAVRQRKVSWDVVRVLCVLMVVTYHATFIGPIVQPVLEPRSISFPFQVGASSLLMISAYFTARSLSHAQPLQFWWSRIARLLPPFLAAVLVTSSLLYLIAPPDWWRPNLWQIGGNLLMLWSVDPAGVPYIDGSYWTLPLQLMAFTLAAALVAYGWRAGWRLRVVLWAAVLVPLALWPIRNGDPPELYRAVVDTLGFHRLHLFVMGVALWLWSTRRIGHLHGLALGLACLLAHAAHTGGDLAAVVGLGVVLALSCLAAAGPDWGRWLPTPVRDGVCWLAGISYGVYLMHQTLGFLVMRWVHDRGGGQLFEVVAMFVCSVVLGWLLTNLVERPVARAAVVWSQRAPARSETVGTRA